MSRHVKSADLQLAQIRRDVFRLEQVKKQMERGIGRDRPVSIPSLPPLEPEEGASAGGAVPGKRENLKEALESLKGLVP